LSSALRGDALRDRAALVTGVGRRGGIGFAIARAILSLGAGVFATSWPPYDQEQSEGEVAGIDELRSIGPPVEHAPIDLSAPGSAQVLVDVAADALGHIDALVVNHARSSRQRLEELTADELDFSFATNARSTLLLVKEWAARHDDSRPGGRVVLLTSGQHLGPMPTELP
jgi:3-oxoacyl-[acyl-carrier protein] reductase